MKDYYKVLGLEKSATHDDIANAYRQLAKKYHPDINPDKTDEFKAVAEAYEVLGDEQRRREHDYGSATMDFVGHPFRAYAKPKTFYSMEIDFMSAAKGCKREIQVPEKKSCGNCRTTGYVNEVTCQQCQGSGQLLLQHGVWKVNMTCKMCGGTGVEKREVCPKCDKGFIVTGQETLIITVPPGTPNQSLVTLREKGDYTKEGRCDLLVQITVLPHEFFTMQGFDLTCKVPVQFTQLVLGDEIAVPNLDGELTVKIPAGTPAGSKLKLKGQGIKSNRGQTGSLYVTLIQMMPELTEEYRAKLLELRELETKYSSKEVIESGQKAI